MYLQQERVSWLDALSLCPARVPGGQLAHATKDSIAFDRREAWRLQGQPPRGRRAALQPCLREVCTHEIGHVLGLKHSGDPRDLMAPYYVEGRLALTAGDREALRALVRRRLRQDLCARASVTEHVRPICRRLTAGARR